MVKQQDQPEVAATGQTPVHQEKRKNLRTHQKPADVRVHTEIGLSRDRGIFWKDSDRISRFA